MDTILFESISNGVLCFGGITDCSRCRNNRLSLTMKKLRNIHPGEVLREEFLLPFGISAYRLAKDTRIPQTRVSQILKGNRRITADTAIRLSKYFGTSAEFWLGLQNDYDLEEERRAKKDEFGMIELWNIDAA